MAWTSPRTWIAGEVPPAATWNTHVRDNLLAIGDAWTAWTPTVTATTGTFTTVSGAGQYIAVGKLIIWSATVTITTAGTAAGTLLFTLPVTAVANRPLGGGLITATGAIVSVSVATSGTTGRSLRYDGVTPIASGYTLLLSGTYEAA